MRKFRGDGIIWLGKLKESNELTGEKKKREKEDKCYDLPYVSMIVLIINWKSVRNKGAVRNLTELDWTRQV